MPLPRLRAWLLTHRTAYAARDAVWRDLVTRARGDGPEWMIATVGMAMPALVRFAGSLARGYRGDPDDLDAEILTGFLDARPQHRSAPGPAVRAAVLGRVPGRYRGP